MTGAIAGNLVYAVAYILDLALSIYIWVIIIAVVFSWVRPTSYHPTPRSFLATLEYAVTRLTEPVFMRIRSFLPTAIGGLDLSPIVVFFIIYFIKIAVVSNLFVIAFRLGARPVM